MTTQYIDPQIIFASDAPAQDKPPAFNNYVKGMDETRSNDGRPTIKQLNFIQQQNDFKFLYIHERGACLPFVEGFPYENNAVVFKDGFIQQKNGSSWLIPFMRGSQNLAELTDVAQARTKLDVYSKAETLNKANNLSELTDKGVARTNLGVYSKSETDDIAGTTNATETVAGKAKIATTAVAQAGVNDTDFITSKKLRDALNATGEAPISACRAWAYFNGGTNPPTILSSFNVLSIAQISSGVWDVTFLKNMPHENYAVLTSAVDGAGAGGVSKTSGSNTTGSTDKTISKIRVAYGTNNSSYQTFMSVGVFC